MPLPGWNVLDAIVVIVSVVSLGPNSLLNMTVIRMLRALRVLRLFGRVESLKKARIHAHVDPISEAYLVIVLQIFALLHILQMDF